MAMESHYVITISRQFASMGRSIAKRTSEKLGIYFMDRDIVEETAKRMELPISEIGEQEEKAKNPYFYRKFPLGIAPRSVEDRIFDVQSSIIKDVAAKQDCIIVGRCAESVLRDKTRRLSVYIRAPYDARFRNCTQKLQMSDATAMKMIHDVDIARENYRRRYIEEIEDVFTDRDIVLDSSVFGVEGCADIIAAVAREIIIK